MEKCLKNTFEYFRIRYRYGNINIGKISEFFEDIFPNEMIEFYIKLIRIVYIFYPICMYRVIQKKRFHFYIPVTFLIFMVGK